MAKPIECFGTRVISIRYQHAEDGELYEHKFTTRVELWEMDDGSLGIISPTGKRLITER